MEIKRVAVIGAGVMGSGIAAHIANAGVPVLLLDIVPRDAAPDKRSAIAEAALERKAEGRVTFISGASSGRLYRIEVDVGNDIQAVNLQNGKEYRLAIRQWVSKANWAISSRGVLSRSQSTALGFCQARRGSTASRAIVSRWLAAKVARRAATSATCWRTWAACD